MPQYVEGILFSKLHLMEFDRYIQEMFSSHAKQ